MTVRMTRLHRTVLFSASGGLFAIAFALLGSGHADAAPAPDFRSGDLRPGSAPKKPAPPPKPAPASVAKKTVAQGRLVRSEKSTDDVWLTTDFMQPRSASSVTPEGEVLAPVTPREGVYVLGLRPSHGD